MPLSDIRARFIVATGRKDLVNEDGSDNCANAFINAGMRLLDSIITNPKTRCWFKNDLAVGQVKLEIEHCRIIDEVWVMNADGRTQLDVKSLEWLRENYADATTDIDRGRPTYYSSAVLPLAPSQVALTAENFTDEFTYDFEDILFADKEEYRGVIFLPPADLVYTMSILGSFFHKPLTLDADENYWTKVHSELLVYAAGYSLEIFYRNTEGANDWMRAILRYTMEIERDLIEEQSKGITQMGG